MNDNPSEINSNAFRKMDSIGESSGNIGLGSMFMAVIARPWILLSCLVIVLVPLLYHLSNIKTVYKSSSNVMVSVWGSTFLGATPFLGQSSGYGYGKTEKYYTSILDSRAYRTNIAKTISNLYPNMPIDSLLSIARGSVGYSTNRRDPGFIKIHARSRNSEFSQILAQTATEEFRTRSIELSREDASTVLQVVKNQIDIVSVKLETTEEDLQQFLSDRKLFLPNVDSGIANELFELERNYNEADANIELINISIDVYEELITGKLTNLTSDIAAIEEDKLSELKSRLTELRKTLNNLDSVDLSQSEIQALKTEREQVRNELIVLASPVTLEESTGETNSRVTIQKLEDELEGSLLERTRLQNQFRFLRIQIERFKNEHPDISEDVLTYASLGRAKEVLTKTLDILLAKREEVQIRAESELGGIKIIDAPPLPLKPLPKKRLQTLIIGFISALLLGVVLSVLVDIFDKTIKDQDDIQNLLGLSVFGTIPSLDVGKFRKPSGNNQYTGMESTRLKYPVYSSRLLSNFSEKSPVAEAYRSSKIAIQFLASDRLKKIFVISSPSVSEGKSLTTANLAISFAQGGNRTLIIDCDLRKTVQHKYFGIERKPGLTDFLYGESELEDIIQEHDVSNLSIITSGSSPTNPAELLASKKMKELMKKLREEYDFILIDTPPILVCADSRVLAETSDGMILIAKVESTNIRALGHAIDLTKHLDIDILGVILNQVNFRFGRAYYYSYRYYKPYSYYSGYYYKSQYYDYSDNEDGESTKIPDKEKKRVRKGNRSDQV